MPRRRVQLDGVPLHIAKRGHNREARFFTKDNYARYLRWLHEASGIGYRSWLSWRYLKPHPYCQSPWVVGTRGLIRVFAPMHPPMLEFEFQLLSWHAPNCSAFQAGYV